MLRILSFVDCRFEFEYTQTQPIDNPHQNVERPLEEEEEEEFVDLTEEVGDCGIVVATEEGLMDLDDDEQMPDTSNSIDYEENDPPHDPLGDLPNDDLHQAGNTPKDLIQPSIMAWPMAINFND